MPIEGMTNSSDWNKTAIKVNIKNVLQEGRMGEGLVHHLMDDYDDLYQIVEMAANIIITTTRVLH